MDTNEITANEAVIEATAEISNASYGKSFNIVAGIGFGVLVGVMVYKYLVKPRIAKIKAVNEQQKINEEFEMLDDVAEEETEESE